MIITDDYSMLDMIRSQPVKLYLIKHCKGFFHGYALDEYPGPLLWMRCRHTIIANNCRTTIWKGRGLEDAHRFTVAEQNTSYLRGSICSCSEDEGDGQHERFEG